MSRSSPRCSRRRSDHRENRIAAASWLHQAKPEYPAGSAPTVAGCIGVAVGLLDDWLSGRGTRTPANLAASIIRLPSGHWVGERAAVDMLSLARKQRAFSLVGHTDRTQGGKQGLYGSAIALVAILQAWAHDSGVPAADLVPMIG